MRNGTVAYFRTSTLGGAGPAGQRPPASFGLPNNARAPSQAPGDKPGGPHGCTGPPGPQRTGPPSARERQRPARRTLRPQPSTPLLDRTSGQRLLWERHRLVRRRTGWAAMAPKAGRGPIIHLPSSTTPTRSLGPATPNLPRSRKKPDQPEGSPFMSRLAPRLESQNKLTVPDQERKVPRDADHVRPPPAGGPLRRGPPSRPRGCGKPPSLARPGRKKLGRNTAASNKHPGRARPLGAGESAWVRPAHFKGRSTSFYAPTRGPWPREGPGLSPRRSSRPWRNPAQEARPSTAPNVERHRPTTS